MVMSIPCFSPLFSQGSPFNYMAIIQRGPGNKNVAKTVSFGNTCFLRWLNTVCAHYIGSVSDAIEYMLGLWYVNTASIKRSLNFISNKTLLEHLLGRRCIRRISAYTLVQSLSDRGTKKDLLSVVTLCMFQRAAMNTSKKA